MKKQLFTVSTLFVATTFLTIQPSINKEAISACAASSFTTPEVTKLMWENLCRGLATKNLEKKSCKDFFEQEGALHKIFSTEKSLDTIGKDIKKWMPVNQSKFIKQALRYIANPFYSQMSSFEETIEIKTLSETLIEPKQSITYNPTKRHSLKVEWKKTSNSGDYKYLATERIPPNLSLTNVMLLCISGFVYETLIFHEYFAQGNKNGLLLYKIPQHTQLSNYCLNSVLLGALARILQIRIYLLRSLDFSQNDLNQTYKMPDYDLMPLYKDISPLMQKFLNTYSLVQKNQALYTQFFYSVTWSACLHKICKDVLEDCIDFYSEIESQHPIKIRSLYSGTSAPYKIQPKRKRAWEHYNFQNGETVLPELIPLSK